MAPTVSRTKAEVVEPKHPAKFSPSVLEAMKDVLTSEAVKGLILDPFAGVGRIHRLRSSGFKTIGVELEPEWADANPHTQQGDATKLPRHWANRFAAVATSPPYANRLADNYAGDAKGSRRYTYRIALGHALTTGSVAGLQWGQPYREMMRQAHDEMMRVLLPGGLLLMNVSDHVRKGELQGVPQWFEADLTLRCPFEHVVTLEVPTPRMGHGANAKARARCEMLYVFRKPVEL